MKLGKNLTIIILSSIGSVTILEMYALSQGIDGVLLTGAIGAIVGIPAWFVSKHRAQEKQGAENDRTNP